MQAQEFMYLFVSVSVFSWNSSSFTLSEILFFFFPSFPLELPDLRFPSQRSEVARIPLWMREILWPCKALLPAQCLQLTCHPSALTQVFVFILLLRQQFTFQFLQHFRVRKGK